MAKVVPLADAKAFLDTLEKSGLLEQKDVETVRASSGEGADPKQVARDLVRDAKLTRWQAGQLLHGFHQLIVGKYKLLDQLGSGEMGRVYLAEHAQMGRKASLKILSRKHTSQPEILKKFLEDARRVSALDHRNLSHVFDVNSEDERYFLVTEFVEGKDLQRLVEGSGATAPQQACDFIRQAAEGLAHAHERHVIHGDLKPSNLLIDSQGTVKLLDLGLSRLTQATPVAGTEESTELATPASQSFHAPEQREKKTKLTPLTDIYSLGAVLYYLLSGKAPLSEVCTPQDVQIACPEVGDSLAELCARMLAKDPTTRPQSALEVIAGLDAARANARQAAKTGNGKPAKPQNAGNKQRKPLIAKALEVATPLDAAALVSAEPESIPFPTDSLDGVTMDAVAPAEASIAPAMPAEDDPLGGFAIQTSRKRPANKTAPAANKGAVTDPVAAPAAPSGPAVKQGVRNLPLILGSAIGGGLVIIGLAATLIYIMMSGGSTPSVDKDKLAKVEKKDSTAKTAAAEANPEANPEENPKVEVVPSATLPSATAKVDTTSPTNPATAPGPMPGATPPMPAATVPMPAPGTNPPAAAKTEPAKTEPAKTEPAKTEPAVSVGNPFDGFLKFAALPPLEEKGKTVAALPPAAVLGPIKLPPKALCLIKLKGGESAVKGKQKFVLEAANNGTAERDWEIKLATDSPATSVIVAKLAIQNDQLNFEWTENALKQASAPYLCNCVFTMAAGTGSHDLFLRQPIVGDPMTIELEKPMTAKWTIDYPPNSKQIVIDVGPVEGPPKSKIDPKQELEAARDSTVVKVGDGEEVLILHFKLDVSMSTKQLIIKGQPQYQLEGMMKPDNIMKGTLAKLSQLVEGQFAEAGQNLTIANANPNAEEKAAQLTQANFALGIAEKRKAQFKQLKGLADALQGKGKIHFHVYYLAKGADANDIKVDLMSTGAAPPAAASPPAGAAK